PLSDSTGAIQTVNMEGGNAGNSPYLSFARMLKRELGYPIGLIPTAMGGTPLSAWNPDEDGYLYRNMLEIVWSQSKHVKGVLWYQGCDDASDAVPELSKSYFDRFRNMVEHLRKDFDNNELPVFTVQLNRMLQLSDQPDTGAWGVVREAQRQAGRKISNTYVVSSLDLPLTDFIHISSAGQLVLGERLAKMALTQLYGRHYICKAPDLSRAEKTGANEVRLIFDNVNCRLCTPDVYGARSLEIDVAALPFSVADQKGPLKIINCEINDKNTIKLRLDREIKGNAVVHGAYEKRQNHLIPVDIEGRLPMLAFYGAELQSV
ncbi:MAG: sialate O-acetylesterase, partial [Clostridia bacterium]|nr:sialate O-acetylesterase [Clostridia bacterium]